MSLKSEIDLQKLPQHIAIIMDGNGRWAKQHGKNRVFGHTNGVKAVRETSEACAEMGVKQLTLYAFSTENWNRPMEEVSAITANNLQIEYEALGAESAPAILLIMGLGAQLARWNIELCEALVDRGYRVIRFDNRDCGLSSKLDQAGVPDVGRGLRTGTPLVAPYTLEDMAADCIGLLDALGIAKAHVVGASMGGAIAQVVAALYPQRTRSLTSIMSTSSHPDLPPPTPEAAQALMAPLPPTRDKEALIEDAIKRQLAVASPEFPSCPQRLRNLFTEEHERGFHPRGVTQCVVKPG